MEVTSNYSTVFPTNASLLDNGTTSPGGYSQMMIKPIVFEVYNIYLYLMICFGVPENLVVLVVFTRHRPTTTTDWFIVFITLCDFISFAVNVPVYATFTNGFWRLYGTTGLCRIHMFISQTLVLSSSFLISGLAIDRYIKVCRHKWSFSKAKARNGCIITMIVTSLLSVPCFTMYENRFGRCVSVVMDTELFAYYLFVFFTFAFAVVTVVFSYFKVTNAVIKSETNVKRHTNTFRSNRVVPSTSNKTSGLFKDTVFKIEETATVSRNLVGSEDSSIGVDISKQGTAVSMISREPSSTQNGVAPAPQKAQRPVMPAQTQQTLNSSTRTTKIAFGVCAVFILTWIPPWVSFFFATVPSLKTDIEVIKFMIYGRMTYLVNGVANPILYAWLNRKFRGYIKETFCCGKS